MIVKEGLSTPLAPGQELFLESRLCKLTAQWKCVVVFSHESKEEHRLCLRSLARPGDLAIDKWYNAVSLRRHRVIVRAFHYLERWNRKGLGEVATQRIRDAALDVVIENCAYRFYGIDNSNEYADGFHIDEGQLHAWVREIAYWAVMTFRRQILRSREVPVAVPTQQDHNPGGLEIILAQERAAIAWAVLERLLRFVETHYGREKLLLLCEVVYADSRITLPAKWTEQSVAAEQASVSSKTRTQRLWRLRKNLRKLHIEDELRFVVTNQEILDRYAITARLASISTMASSLELEMWVDLYELVLVRQKSYSARIFASTIQDHPDDAFRFGRSHRGIRRTMELLLRLLN